MSVLTTSVTALRFISVRRTPTAAPCVFLFAGVGNHIQIYNQNGCGYPLVNKAIFPPSISIHGFSDVSMNGLVAVHAARTVATLKLEFSDAESLSGVYVTCTHDFDDWVWHVHWLCQTTSLLAVACGHSKTWVGFCPHFSSFARIDSENSQLSWSSTIFLHPASSTFYNASGSSFGEVFVWKLGSLQQLCSISKSIEAPNISSPCRQPHKLNAHHGPVMRIVVSTDASFMTTVSVDRSVRIWRASKSIQCSSCPPHGCFVPLLTHFGHLGRVWDVAFLHSEFPVVASVGEDRTCRLWSGQNENLQIDNYRDHAGRNIWTIATAALPEKNAVIIATGGEDGSIKTRFLAQQEIVESSAIVCSEHVSANITGHFRLPGKLRNPRKPDCTNCTDESGRAIVMASSSSLFLTTDYGRIMAASWGIHNTQYTSGCYPEFSNDSIKWKEIFRDPDGVAFTPSSLVWFGNFVCAGQTNGSIVIVPIALDFVDPSPTVKMWKRFQGFDKRFGMTMGLFGATEPDSHYYDLFVATVNGDLHHWCIQDFRQSTLESDIASSADMFEYHKITTYAALRNTKSALVTSVNYLKERELIIIGDRGGRLRVYRAPSRSNLDIDSRQNPVVWKRTHDDRVSCLLKLDNSQILSCGFDGRVVTSTIRNFEENHECTQVKEERNDRAMERFETIIRVFVNTENSDIILCGFRGAVLSAWDVEGRSEIFRHDVGNWRRAHDVFLSASGRITVGYWRAGQLCVATSGRPESVESQFPSDKAGGPKYGGVEFHGGRANDVAWIGDDMVMTGGEDTSVRITKINKLCNSFEKVQRLDGHISSINSLCMTTEDLAASCGGADEVLLWERNDYGLWRCGSSFKVGDVLSSGSSDSRTPLRANRDAIMRVTSISALNAFTAGASSGAAWIVGRSDGQVVKVAAVKTELNWKVTGHSIDSFGNEAVLCVYCCQDGRIVSGGSGGTILVWDATENLILKKSKGHEGGVNCIAVRKGNENRGMIVVSGGDDCRVKLWVEKDRWQSVESYGHHAAVTGITWVKGVEHFFVSSGADQRVCVWRCDGANIQLVHKASTAVPDVAAVIARSGVGLQDAVSSTRELRKSNAIEIVVCGLGLQMISVRMQKCWIPEEVTGV